ncbi:MAG: ABC transporter ATP-binding protein [Thermoleophilia bacterium]|nr:ABC transporter ATP-binding protein [Thermoleophilia bacterium]
MTPLPLEARDLYRFFHVGDDETLALRGVSLSARGGEIVAVTGPSGSGKSTLLNCLAGLDEPDGGTVRIAGQPLSRRPEPERARLRAGSIGMLFQSTNLVQHLDVSANVALAQRLAGNATPASVDELVASVGLGLRAHALPSELSGGESARAGLAVALANGPAVVLADEPTGELDRGTAAHVLDLLRARADAGSAVVLVTHSPQVAAAADRTVQLHDGKVVAE